MSRRTDAQTESRALALYAGNLSTREVGRRLGLHPTTVGKILVRYGAARRAATCPPTHALDANYFETIDTEAKGYWLGFVAADGCVTDSGEFVMTLAAVDAAHLEAFRAAVGYGGRVRRFVKKGRTSAHVTLGIGRKRFVNHLKALGISPRKTHALGAPAGVPDELLRHYHRGAFDGDGSISRVRTGRDRGLRWSVDFCGTLAAVRAFAAFVEAGTGVAMKPRAAGSIWKVKTSGIDYPQRVVRLLYADSRVSLARKKALADELLAATPRRARRPFHVA